MLQITIPATVSEAYDDVSNEFIYTVTEEEQTLQLEHSLDSLSRWESKWCKSFLYSKDKTDEEILDYIRCMTLTPDVSPHVYDRLTPENIEQIQKYINAPMTATTFSNNQKGKGSREVITAEIIYYWLAAAQIPFECQYWHLNKLITLIRVYNAKNQTPKKTNSKDIASRNAALNAARKQKQNTRG